MRSTVAMKTVMSVAVAGVMVTAGGTLVNAAAVTEPLAVSAAVAAKCTIDTTAVAFGSYDPIGAHAATPLTGTGSVTITCTKKANATVALSTGAHADGSTRRMSDGDATAESFLEYELYTDNLYGSVWNVVDPGPAPDKDPRTLTVYGRVAANQDVAAGNYTDTVVATVNF